MFCLCRRFVSFLLSLCLLVFVCVNPVNAQQKVDQAADFKGTIVEPIEFGQPNEGAGLKAYGLKLAKPMTFNDKNSCGEQTVNVLPIESDIVKAYVGKAVVLRATPYCRVNRTGKYHLKDISIQ